MDYRISSVLPEDATITTTDLLAALGVGAHDLKAVWFGPPMAQLVVPARFDDQLVVTTDGIRTFGQGDCMAAALRDLNQELRDANECTCTFGHEGAFQALAITQDICAKRGKPGDLDLLRDLAPAMSQYAICELGRAQGRMMQQVLMDFADEIEAHLDRATCPADSCAAFKTFHILVSRCTGCGACLKACNDDALMGKPRFVHVIDQRACTQCGACLAACPENAVVMAGAQKPKTPPRPIPCKRT